MKKFHAMRLERGWSRLELSRRAGLAYGTVMRIERGERRPQEWTARKLGHAFGLSWDEAPTVVEDVSEHMH